MRITCCGLQTAATYPATIEYIRQIVRSQLYVRPAARSGPAYEHLPTCQHFKLKVPLPSGDRIGLLHAEEADSVNALPLYSVGS